MDRDSLDDHDEATCRNRGYSKPVILRRCPTSGRAVRVDRPGPWGNVFVVGANDVRTAREASELYERLLLERPRLLARLPELRGRDLACGCRGALRSGPYSCHAKVLLRLAN